MSVRAIGVGGQWFDVFIDDFTPLHGTQDIAEAWRYLRSPMVRLKYNLGDGETRFPQGSEGLLLSENDNKCSVHVIDPRKILTCYLAEIERL